jgi:hypothetical protein
VPVQTKVRARVKAKDGDRAEGLEWAAAKMVAKARAEGKVVGRGTAVADDPDGHR